MWNNLYIYVWNCVMRRIIVLVIIFFLVIFYMIFIVFVVGFIIFENLEKFLFFISNIIKILVVGVIV